MTDKLVGYKISDIDDGGSTKYFGFIDHVGNWYILKLTDSTARYTRGSANTNYEAHWANRANLTYGKFNDVFKLVQVPG